MKRELFRKSLVCFIIALPLEVSVVSSINASISKTSANDDWYICSVIEGGFNSHCSLALDSNNYPNILGGWGGRYINYTRWNGSEWEHFDKIYEEYSYPYSNSMVLDSKDNPHICYYAVQNGYCFLKYATLNGTKWDITDIDYGGPGFAFFNSIDIDSQNNPHILYTTDYYTGYLKYAKFNGYKWKKEIVDDSWIQVANDVDFALDVNNSPHIAYYDGNYSVLRYAKWNGYEWVKEIVDNSTEAGEYISLVLDDREQPHISYVRRLEGSSWWYGNIKYAYQDKQNWTIEEVTTGNTTGWGTSIALGSNSNPFISYIEGDLFENSGNVRLVYASRIDGNWENEIVDSGCPCYPSLAIDSNDNLYIGYCDSDGVRFATTVNLFNNQPPNAPTINGQTSGKVRKEYDYTFVTIDPEKDNISSYIINWDDGMQDIVHCSVVSGEELVVAHEWNEVGTYIIKARSKDTHNLWGPWATLEVTMPRYKSISNSIFLRFLERYPLLQTLLLRLGLQ